jgi:tRNA 2-thiouridine synthesizing protein A
MTIDEDLDARGLICPLPVLKTRKTLQGLAPGAVLRVRADDPVARIDLPHFCAEAGHDLLDTLQADGHFAFVIRKRA